MKAVQPLVGDGRLERRVVCLALVHHANQYLITDGYRDRDGLGEILGLGPLGACQRGLLRLLQMHLDYRVPVNLHLSGTLLEAIAWHYPESLGVITELRRQRLLELIGSAFSQNIMPLFSDEHNLRQLNEELWLYRVHLKCSPRAVTTCWVPERVWETNRLARALRSRRLLNGGYRHVLVDDRLLYAGGGLYEGSERERFDRENPLDPEAFVPWRIRDGRGLVALALCKELRYLIPPPEAHAFARLEEIFRWLASVARENTLAVYGDDLERAAGVGGWDRLHAGRYERFLQWLAANRWVTPVLIGRWAALHDPAGVRTIERGTFYELARSWKGGEDYRGWSDDPQCAAHREYLRKAERAIVAARARRAPAALLELAWKHLLHCAYETAWHNCRVQPMRLEAWAGALSSHARACQVIVAAAEWCRERDGLAHAELVDLDGDGEAELVLKSDRLFAVFAPSNGGRLVYLFDLTGRAARLVIGNISDDWNLQEELNRYMDCPPNHPGAFADVEHEHDAYRAAIVRHRGPVAWAALQNVQRRSVLRGGEKRVRLAATAAHLCVDYLLPPAAWRVSSEFCFSPDYHRLLRYGRTGLRPCSGPHLKGWRRGAARVWVRLDPRQRAFWDRPRQSECGHGLTMRVTSFSRHFHLEVGVGRPPVARCRASEIARPAMPGTSGSQPCVAEARRP